MNEILGGGEPCSRKSKPRFSKREKGNIWLYLVKVHWLDKKNMIVTRFELARETHHGLSLDLNVTP